MLLDSETALEMVATAVDALSTTPDSFSEKLDELPAPIYVTDAEGTITYYNKACIDLAGRTPKVGTDKWCVTWKIFTPEGEFLPHDQCPMSVALREKRAVRDVEAIAERPDGTRVPFLPFPTPFFDSDGNLAGAVNVLVDLSPVRGADYLREQAERCRELARSMGDIDTAQRLSFLSANYDLEASKAAWR